MPPGSSLFDSDRCGRCVFLKSQLHLQNLRSFAQCCSMRRGDRLAPLHQLGNGSLDCEIPEVETMAFGQLEPLRKGIVSTAELSKARKSDSHFVLVVSGNDRNQLGPVALDQVAAPFERHPVS